MAGTTTAATPSVTISVRELAGRLLGLPGAARGAECTGDSTCACGQALDCCHSGHCPRCGVALRSTT